MQFKQHASVFPHDKFAKVQKKFSLLIPCTVPTGTLRVVGGFHQKSCKTYENTVKGSKSVGLIGAVAGLILAPGPYVWPSCCRWLHFCKVYRRGVRRDMWTCSLYLVAFMILPQYLQMHFSSNPPCSLDTYILPDFTSRVCDTASHHTHYSSIFVKMSMALVKIWTCWY